MTVEEKAKAYDKALEKTRIYRDNARIAEDYVAVARYENIFPELRESEDERIRRELIEFIKWSVDRHFMREDFHQAKRPSEWIAYLEKQKEQKWSPSESEMGVLYKLCYISNQITDEDDTELTRLYQDLKLEYFNGHSFENMFPSENQKDHFRDDTKMVEKQDYSSLNDLERAIHRGFLSAGVENVPVAIIKETAKECLAQMNPAEINVKALLAADRLASAEMTGRLKERSEILENPEKYGLQKPAEWSEDDEKKRQRIIKVIEAADSDWVLQKAYGPYGDLINWLKSLRPVSKESLQPHWKPSEEQMKMLAMFSNLRCVSRQEAATLESLYNDLKKLM